MKPKFIAVKNIDGVEVGINLYAVKRWKVDGDKLIVWVNGDKETFSGECAQRLLTVFHEGAFMSRDCT